MRLYHAILLFVFGICFCHGSLLHASEVKLEEIPLSLYNKPVTGYRFTLDRSQRFVEQQIMRHVSEADPMKPFQYERTLIYENIYYKPITTEQPISLYYLMRGYENHYTELTLVAMYDYRRSINSRDFPSLSLSLQLDLARLVRRTSGDQLKFGDIVFDDATIKKLQSEGLSQPNDPNGSSLGEEEVDRNKAIMPKGGFKEGIAHGDGGNPDSTIQALRMRIMELETRQQQLAQQEANLRSQQRDADEQQAIIKSKTTENKRLRDSIAVLNVRVQAMLGHAYVADDVSISNETADLLARLEGENNRQRKMIASLQRENDSLEALSLQQKSQLETVSRGRLGMQDEIARLKSDNSNLQVQINRLRDDLEARPSASAKDPSADSLSAQLRAVQRKNASQVQELEAMRNETAQLQRSNDQLNSKIGQLQNRIEDLEVENRQLANKPAGTVSQPSQGTALEDTLTQLRQRMAFLESKAKENESLRTQLKQKDESLRLKETEAKSLQTRLNASQTELETSQAERKKAEQNLSTAQANLRSTQQELSSTKAEQDRLKAERTNLQNQLSALESSNAKESSRKKALTDSLFTLQKALDKNDKLLSQKTLELQIAAQRRDSLDAQLRASQLRENNLTNRNAELQSRVDSLGKLAMPVTDQQRFIREQWAKLGDWEKELESRKRETENLEKLSNQRAKSLDERQKELDTRASAITNLEERERQVKLREQQLDTRENLSASNVTPDQVKLSKINEFGGSTPVFSVETEMNFRSAQRQVVAYMLSRDILLSEQFPDLTFKNAYLGELSEGQVEVKVRIDTKGAGSLLQISVMLPDGSYIGQENNTKLNEAAKQFVTRMMRFKP